MNGLRQAADAVLQCAATSPSGDDTFTTSSRMESDMNYGVGQHMGKRRNRSAMGFINLIYNLARHEPIMRLKLLPLRAV